MKKIIFLALMSLGVASVLSLSVASSNAFAQVSSGINAATTDEMKNKQIDGSNGVIRIVSNILIWVVGIVAVIMIVWSGFKYITAAGDSGKIASAKSSLIYAIVGLIIAILAYAIVNFVMERLNVSSTPGGSSGGGSSGGAGSSGGGGGYSGGGGSIGGAMGGSGGGSGGSGGGVGAGVLGAGGRAGSAAGVGKSGGTRIVVPGGPSDPISKLMKRAAEERKAEELKRKEAAEKAAAAAAAAAGVGGAIGSGSGSGAGVGAGAGAGAGGAGTPTPSKKPPERDPGSLR